MTRAQREAALLRHWLEETGRAAAAFEARWSYRTLQRVDPDIAQRLREQRGLFDTAAVTGTAAKLEEQGAALVRGYVVAAGVVEQAGASEDACLVGYDPRSGLRVAIAEQQAALARARELHGDEAITMTPDEVAAILGHLEALKPVLELKRVYPGAEVMDVRSRGDGDLTAAG